MLKIDDELIYMGYGWTVALVEGDDIRLESDRLDDDQPYWLWLSLEDLLYDTDITKDREV